MVKLHDIYRQEVVKALVEKFGYKTVMQVPRIEKITLNMGVGEAVADKKVLENAVKDMTAISGQKPLITKVRKSVAGFKIREGYPIGIGLNTHVSQSIIPFQSNGKIIHLFL